MPRGPARVTWVMVMPCREADACLWRGSRAVTSHVPRVPPLCCSPLCEAPGHGSDTLGTWLSEPACQWGAHVSTAGDRESRAELSRAGGMTMMSSKRIPAASYGSSVRHPCHAREGMCAKEQKAFCIEHQVTLTTSSRGGTLGGWPVPSRQSDSSQAGRISSEPPGKGGKSPEWMHRRKEGQVSSPLHTCLSVWRWILRWVVSVPQHRLALLQAMENPAVHLCFRLGDKAWEVIR